jgi:UDP-N-acetylglucosamine diphosphorylase/glucosamine-1-phosphate N-acetyltransferase
MIKDQFIILAAGKGTRLNHDHLPKVLVPFLGKPLIVHVLSQISRIAKSQKPIIVVGFLAEKVKQALGSRYEYVLQEEQLGTAHAVSKTKDVVDAENVLILYGDMPFITEESLRKFMRLHHDHKANLSMLTTKVPNFKNQFAGFENFGRIIRSPSVLTKGKEIVKITEFKDCTEQEKQIKEVNPGVYMFNTKWLWQNIKKIKNKNAQKEYYLTDIVEIAIAQKEKIYSLEVSPKEVMGINSLEDLELAEKAF